MAKLPKKFIKKFGISKRAWTEFRKSKKGSSRKKTTSAKRKPVKRRQTMTKGSRARTLFFGLKDSELIGGFGYAVTEPMIDQFTSGIGSNIPIVGNVGDDIIKLLIGLAGRKYTKTGILKGVTNSMVHVNLYKVAKMYAPNLLGNLQGTARNGTGLEGF